MLSTRFFSAACLSALLVSPALTCMARDTEDQIKAREALRKKMEELSSQSAPTPPPKPPPSPEKPTPAAPPAPKKSPAPAPKPTAVAAPAAAPVVAEKQTGQSAFSSVPEAVEDPNIVKARDALRQELSQPSPVPAAPDVKPAAPAPAVAAPQPKAVAAPVAAVPVVAEKQSAQSVFSPVPDPAVNPNDQRARDALRQELSKASPGPAPAAPDVKPPAPKPVAAAPAATALETPPQSPLTGSKEARLDELLRRYKADQISPQQYHTQRAAIVAEP